MPTTDRYYAVVASRALPVLFQKAATSFPSGTRLTDLPDSKDDVVSVSLNKNFVQPGFWRNKQQTLLAVYAIVNSTDSNVRFLIDGKPLRNLANIDLRKPLEPRMDLVLAHKKDKWPIKQVLAGTNGVVPEPNHLKQRRAWAVKNMGCGSS